MISDDLLIDFLASTTLSQRDKVLLMLLANDTNPIPIRTIQSFALAHGVRQVTSWNISRILTNTKQYVVKMREGWTLTVSGRKYVHEKLLPDDLGSTKEAAQNLRHHLDQISNPDTRGFVEEAIKCLECGLLRSAVVMSWIGAISLLYDYVIADRDRLAGFNERAAIRFPRNWRTAVTRDDLAQLKESEFLDILVQLSILDRNTKKSLVNTALTNRNSCGHPSELRIGKHMVEAHLELLIQNIYGNERFGGAAQASRDEV